MFSGGIHPLVITSGCIPPENITLHPRVTLHYITLHYIQELHHITLHYIQELHHITLHPLVITSGCNVMWCNSCCHSLLPPAMDTCKVAIIKATVQQNVAKLGHSKTSKILQNIVQSLSALLIYRLYIYIVYLFPIDVLMYCKCMEYLFKKVGCSLVVLKARTGESPWLHSKDKNVFSAGTYRLCYEAVPFV